MPCSLGETGKSTLGPMIWRSVDLQLHAAGRARPARTTPVTSTDVSCVSRPNVSHAAGHVGLREDGLHMPRAVAQRGERDLAARARGHHPPAHRHRLPDALRQGLDPLSFRHRGGILGARCSTVNETRCQVSGARCQRCSS